MLERILRAVCAAVLAVAIVFATAAAPARAAAKPTVVLVHGAFADASSWSGVVERLQRAGYPVLAPANPLRGLASDTAYLASVLKSVDGPVVLVGHSYGGELISGAASGDPQVKALVYVAAAAPDTGESGASLNARFAGSRLTPRTSVLVPYPGGSDLYIERSAFRSVFAADVPRAKAEAMAVSQRPVDSAALSTPFAGRPAWRTIPSWALVATHDRVIPPAAERFMAARAHSHTVEVASSHAAPVAHPGAVASLVLSAARAVRDHARTVYAATRTA